MTEDSNPTDNGLAERVNGIIKTEKLYRRPLYNTLEEAREGIGQFITFYNDRRPHMSIGYQTPSAVHMQQGPQEKKWKGAIKHNRPSWCWALPNTMKVHCLSFRTDVYTLG